MIQNRNRLSCYHDQNLHEKHNYQSVRDYHFNLCNHQCCGDRLLPHKVLLLFENHPTKKKTPALRLNTHWFRNFIKVIFKICVHIVLLFSFIIATAGSFWISCFPKRLDLFEGQLSQRIWQTIYYPNTFIQLYFEIIHGFLI